MNFDDLYRLLRGARVQAQDIIDTIREPLLVLDEKLCVVAASRSFSDTFCVDRDAILGRYLYELENGQWDNSDLRHLLEAVIHKSAAIEGYEIEHDFPHLGRRILRLNARKMLHPNSTTLLLVLEDVTDGRRKEQENELLLGELHHRVKNLFALVHALARQTEVEGRSSKDYRDAFLGRLDTLMRAHDLAFEAQATADLKELIGRILAPYVPTGQRSRSRPGHRVSLARRQVTPVCLILHELATNAVKHGALSSPAGQVRVGWRHDGDAADGGGRRLALRWTEQGGPEARPPSGRGFGTRLIEFAATQELHGQAELIFAPRRFAGGGRVPDRVGAVS